MGTLFQDRRREPDQALGRDARRGGAVELAEPQFARDVLEGLSRPRKSLPPKYFYDAAGSRLFERICRLREYYPTRTELAITRRCQRQIARFAGKGTTLLEYGSGEGVKTRLLLEALRPKLYMPVDISEDALRRAVARLARQFPRLRIVAVRGDFSRPLELPPLAERGRRVVYFPGSTIGNLTPDEAHAFLRMSRAQVGPRGAMIVGVDLKKDANVLHAAYNDAKGVTAAFNLNILTRINRELGGDFDLRRFVHYAFYEPSAGRIEMHLVSTEQQAVTIGRHRFAFERGESIHTENSYKYSVAEFQALAERAGFRGAKVWTDPRGWFSVHGLLAT
ncbi:MAG TPA: L-histidine N(alpha)-methyltransferase [Burkholderiales bacterium]|nr:L-histidine N(alpha)-methyltransferase [Burkholderiales bacterium]